MYIYIYLFIYSKSGGYAQSAILEQADRVDKHFLKTADPSEAFAESPVGLPTLEESPSSGKGG